VEREVERSTSTPRIPRPPDFPPLALEKPLLGHKERTPHAPRQKVTTFIPLSNIPQLAFPPRRRRSPEAVYWDKVKRGRDQLVEGQVEQKKISSSLLVPLIQIRQLPGKKRSEYQDILNFNLTTEVRDRQVAQIKTWTRVNTEIEVISEDVII
jgi:hypothetical protein